jgi:RNA polymerase sigma-70 factor (ECF subfamily)
MTDTELISAILRGQTTLFEQLVDRYLPMVRGVCASRFRDPATVDDLTQDTFITGFRNLNKLRNPARFGPWMATIARNTCTSHLRSATRRSEMIERATKETNGTAETPEAIAQRRELYAWVHRAIEKLPDKTREAMVLHYVEGLSTSEVAEQTGIREPAVRKRLQYGRQLVGETLWKELEPHRAGARPDTEMAKRRVLKALPLAAAPWLIDGGKAAGATGLLGMLGTGGLVKLGLGIALVAAAVNAWKTTREQIPPANPDQTAVADETLAMNATPITTAANTDPIAQTAPGTESSIASGTLTVQVNLEREEPYPTQRTESGAVVKQLEDQRPADSGQPVPQAVVRVIPMRIETATLRNRFAQTNVDPELADRVVQALQAIFDLRFGLMTSGPPSEADRARDEAIVVKLGISETEMREAMNQLQQVLNDPENAGRSPMDMLFSPVPRSEWLEATTDEHGKVTFTGVAPGRCFVAARDPEVTHEWPTPNKDMASTLEAMDNAGMGILETGVLAGDEKSTTVLIADERSRFTGTVVDKATGAPIERARVEVVSLDVPGAIDDTHTNPDGQYWITPKQIGYGTLYVRITADNYQPVEFSQDRVLGVPTEPQSIELSPKATICGNVTMSDGKPAADVTILRKEPDSDGFMGVAVTDEQGAYCFGHDEGETTLMAHAGTLRTERMTVDLAADQAGRVDFILPPCGSIHVVAQTQAGTPVTTLNHLNVFEGSNGDPVVQRYEMSSSDGNYQVKYLETGVYSIDARANDLEPVILEHIRVTAGRSAGPFYAKLGPAHADLTVRIEDPGGEPHSRYYFSVARIVREDENRGIYGRNLEEFANLRTDAKGEYTLKGLVPGLYRVNIMGGVEAEVPHAGTLVLRPAGRLRATPTSAVQVGAAPYREVDGERVPVHNGRAKTLAIPLSSTVTGDQWLDVTYGANISHPGEYALVYVKRGDTAAFDQFEVSNSDFEKYKQKKLIIEVEIEEAGSIEGAVVDLEGMPVTDHVVGVLPIELWEASLTSTVHESRWMDLATSVAQGAKTDETGAFTIEHLPSGTYVLGVSREAISEPVEVVAGHVTGPVVVVEAE